MDKELLSIVMTLKEFRSMLLGAVINIHTDHINILTLGDSSQRRLRWISYVDEYGPTLHYIKGPNNVIADTFSRMPMKTTAPLIISGASTPPNLRHVKKIANVRRIGTLTDRDTDLRFGEHFGIFDEF